MIIAIIVMGLRVVRIIVHMIAIVSIPMIKK